MSTLKALGLAATLSLLPACGEKPVEQPQLPQQTAEITACERLKMGIALEGIVEQMAQDPAAWKLFPSSLANATWKEVHAKTIVAAAELKTAGDQRDCLQQIKKDQ